MGQAHDRAGAEPGLSAPVWQPVTVALGELQPWRSGVSIGMRWLAGTRAI